MSHESHTQGYSSTATSLMRHRTLAVHGAFLLPLLRPGLRVLDVGCGPGMLTVRLAAAVDPGQVAGLDVDASQLEAAARTALAASVRNVAFVTGSVCFLPFAEGSFDVAFTHAVLEHLADPACALAELGRVLAPGGLIALQSPDWGGHVVAPETPGLVEAIHAYRDLQTRNGGDVLVGRKLVGLVRAAGFSGIVVSATYEVYPRAEIIAEYLAERLDAEPDGGPHAKALRRWSEHLDALFAQAWVETLAWRV